MLADRQLQFYEELGYLVVEDVLDPDNVIRSARQEYLDLIRNLCREWRTQDLVSGNLDEMSFEDMLLDGYRAGCDWFQPMDISLPGERITADPSSELKDWRVWRSMWENARKQLAKRPHIDIHRWQSDSPMCA